MSEISDRYDRLSSTFAATLAAVPEDRWDAATPCQEWTTLDLVRHVVDSQGLFLSLVGREVGPLPPLEKDPTGAFDAARAAVLADLQDPERAGAEFEGHAGRTTLERAVDRFLTFDLVVHRWDLARATGLDEGIDQADLAFVRQGTDAMGDMLHTSGSTAPPLDPPPGADEQTALLARLGRRAW
jgi:uncharacterized protein (TIGR03086 family)